jgi:hypothetical protein
MNATLNHRVRGSKLLRAVIGAGVALAITAPAADAGVRGFQATDQLKTWSSPKSFDTPYVIVTVKHHGKELERTAVSRCKGTFVDKSVTVLVSTCGDHWKVRARYVSMNGHDEHVKIAYAARYRL